MFFSSQILFSSISPGFFAVGFSNPLQTPLIQNFIPQSDSAKQGQRDEYCKSATSIGEQLKMPHYISSM